MIIYTILSTLFLISIMVCQIVANIHDIDDPVVRGIGIFFLMGILAVIANLWVSYWLIMRG